MSGEYPDNQENVNPNNLSNLSSLNVSSLSELEEMIKGAHPSSDKSSSQSDLMQKLKALQLIEQMISNQEQLLNRRQDHGDIKQSEQQTHLALSRAGNDASPVQAPSHHSQQPTAQYTLPSYLSPLPLKVPTTDRVDVFAHDLSTKSHGGSFVNGDSAEEVADLNQHQGVGVEAAHGRLSGHQKEEAEVVGRLRASEAASQPSLKEKREEQLRLLNEKIAQRHSKLPRKTDLTNKTAQASILSSSASKKTNSSVRKQDTSKLKSTSGRRRLDQEKSGPRKAKGHAKAAGKSSKSAPTLHGSKFITSSTSVPLSRAPLPCDNTSHALPTPHLPPFSSKTSDQLTTLPQLQHQLNSPQKDSLDISEQNSYNPSDDVIPMESMSSSQPVEIEEATVATNSSNLLDSTSYLIPVEREEGDETLVADISTMTDEGTTVHSSLPSDVKRADVTCEGDSLASTLTQAYGFSTTSDFLTTLASPHREQLGSVQDPSANSIMKSNRDLSTVQTSLLPASTASASTMTADKAATVIQTAWYVLRSFQSLYY